MKPCPVKTNCPCDDNPLGNFSSEAPDKDVFLGFSTGAVATVPQPGTPFDNPTGYSFCESEESQESADLCAAKGAIENNADNGNPSTPPGNTANDGGNWGVALYQNSEQSCTVDCPNGGQFTYVVPAGAVTDLNPTIVDRAAASLACKNANKFLICIGPLDNVTGVVGTGYFGTVVLTGSFAPYRWTAVTPLPAGLTLDADTAGDTVLSKTVGIIGTPTASGAQAFTLRATDRDGHYAERSFTITVTGTTVTLSDFWDCDIGGDPVSAFNTFFALNCWAFNSRLAGLHRLITDESSGGAYTGLVAGKIANGVATDAANISVLTAIVPGWTPATQDGFTMFGWFKVSTIGASSFQPLSLYLDSIGGTRPAIDYNPGTGRFSVMSGMTAVPPSSIASYFFLAYTYNNVTGAEKAYFNGALFLSGTPGPFADPATANSALFVNGTDSIMSCDQIGFARTGVYTQAQITALYNAGAGVAWPAVNSI